MVAIDKHAKMARLTMGSWLIDLDRATVTIGKDASGLTQPAESLLLLLCRHPNELVTRDQILDAVWAQRVVEDAAITNCVWQIRKGLGEQGKEILQTRTKRGYLLVVPEAAWIADDPVTAASMTEASPNRVSPAIESVADTSTDSASNVPVAALDSRWRSRSVLGAVVAFCCLLLVGFLAWRSQADSPHAVSSMRLDAEIELTVSVVAPEKYIWLQESIMRVAFEQAYLRDTSAFYFERRQLRNPFAGPHLQVEVKSEKASAIVAELSLSQGKKTIRRDFHGSAHQLDEAAEALLSSALQPPMRKTSPATEALVSGLVADSMSNYLGAFANYRRALGLDPDDPQPKLSMAIRLHSLGRSREALELWQELSEAYDLSPRQRCQFELLTLKISDQPLEGPRCARASFFEKSLRADARDLLREVASKRNRVLGAAEWDTAEHAAILAHIELGEFDEARSRIDQAQRVASAAGWEGVRVELGALRGDLELSDGKTDAAVKIKIASAAEAEAAGGFYEALSQRADAIRLQPPSPGEAVAQQRVQLNDIIDQARKIGSIRAEVEALYVLLRLDADHAARWASHVRRIQTLAEKYYSPKLRRQETYYLMIELDAHLQYRQVLEIIRRLNPSKDGFPFNAIGLTLEASAHFERDELPAAAAAIDRIERQKFDVRTTSTCSFALMLAEAKLPDRARAMLSHCDYRNFDRASMSDTGDVGLLAEARLHQLGDQPERAWPTVQPRIDALLAMQDMSRDEADGLALLARYAVSMPGSDIVRLERALAVTSAIAAKDGAGPGLRLGVHVLRWRLCARAGRRDCGPVLPAWGQENLLEARLALDTLPEQLRAANAEGISEKSDSGRVLD